MEADGFAGDYVHEGASLGAWEEGGVEGFCVLFFAKDDAAAWAAEGFVGGGGYEVGIGNWRGVEAGGYEACDVGYVGHEEGTAVFGDLAHALEIDGTGVGGGAYGDHFRFF